jgi:hypothetical protein
VLRSVHGGSIIRCFRPRWPSGVSIVWPAAWLIMVAIPPPTGADESATEGWKFSITPYAWMTGLEGQVGLRGITAAVDASFIDILRDTESVIGLEGHFEARYGPWGGFFDGLWVKLGADGIPAGQTTLRVENQLALVEFGGLYRLGEWSLGHGMSEFMAEGEPRLGIDLYVGGRLTYLDVDLSVNRAPPPDRRDIVPTISVDASRWQLWVDPMLGSRFTLDLYKHFQLLVGGDLGGFGVGSHFTYSVLGLLGYRFQMFGHAAIAHAGYRTLSQNYATRTDGDLFKWDMIMHGPILGLTIRF